MLVLDNGELSLNATELSALTSCVACTGSLLFGEGVPEREVELLRGLLSEDDLLLLHSKIAMAMFFVEEHS